MEPDADRAQGKKADLPPFERLNGEKANADLYLNDERIKDLRDGDFYTDGGGVRIVLRGGQTIPPKGDYFLTLESHITKEIENPPDFFADARFIEVVWLDPVAHCGLVRAAAGGRAVTAPRVGYNNYSRLYFVECGGLHVVLSAETAEGSLRGEPM